VRPTAQADWLLAHLLLDTPYRSAPFALLAGDEAPCSAEARALLAGDLGVMRCLVRTLVLSGFGMTICGRQLPGEPGRAPAQPLHRDDEARRRARQLARRADRPCARLAMARLQDRLLAEESPPVLAPTAIDHADVLRHFGAERGEVCWLEFAAKRLDRARAEAINARLAAGWDAIRGSSPRITLGPARMTRVLTEAGAPITAGALGWPPSLFADALRPRARAPQPLHLPRHRRRSRPAAARARRVRVSVRSARYFSPYRRPLVAAIALADRFQVCVHSGLPLVEYSPTMTSEIMPSGEIRPASENVPSMPAIGVWPGLDFTLSLPGLPALPSMSGVRSMSTWTSLPLTTI